MHSEINISIIIVNYNTRDLLLDCIASIGSRAAQEIIVVDNASTDDSVPGLRSAFPDVKVIENSQNLGFAKANNQGIKKARGKYILLLNSDTVVKAGALEQMVAFLAGHSDVGGVTCRLLNADGTIQACVSKQPGPMLLFFRLSGLSRLFRSDQARKFLGRWLGFALGRTTRGYLLPYSATEQPLAVENISGACLLLRREAIEQVGLLDENFFMYLEDMDYCLRLHKAGWKLYYIPGGEIVHLVGQSSGGRMRSYSLRSYESLLYFYRKNFSSGTLFLVRCMVLTSSILRWLWNRLCSLWSKNTAYGENLADLAQVIRLCIMRAPSFSADQSISAIRTAE